MPAESDFGPLGFVISEELVPSPAHRAAGVTSIDFDGLLNPPLKLVEDLAEGCGGQIWTAGLVLAKYLIGSQSQWSHIRNKTMFVGFKHHRLVYIRVTDRPPFLDLNLVLAVVS